MPSLYFGFLFEQATQQRIYFLHAANAQLPKIPSKPWYKVTPVGVNPLKGMMAKISGLAGLTGAYTNHSLRAISASRMFAAERLSLNSLVTRALKHLASMKGQLFHNCELLGLQSQLLNRLQQV